MAAPSIATKRLRKDAARLLADPVPYVQAAPLPQNILEWHFVVQGPEATPYFGGYYHGKLLFPVDYPFKPPTIFMMTPNGRFRTGSRLCLSISDFHPDSWNPTWSVGTILTGLLSFMLESAPTLGSLQTSDYEKRILAEKSAEFNLKSDTFRVLFPELTEKLKEISVNRRSLGASGQEDPLLTTSITTTVSGSLHSLGLHCFILLAFVAFIFVARSILMLSG